jgi:hypothetical protein
MRVYQFRHVGNEDADYKGSRIYVNVFTIIKLYDYFVSNVISNFTSIVICIVMGN